MNSQKENQVLSAFELAISGKKSVCDASKEISRLNNEIIEIKNQYSQKVNEILDFKREMDFSVGIIDQSIPRNTCQKIVDRFESDFLYYQSLLKECIENHEKLCITVEENVLRGLKGAHDYEKEMLQKYNSKLQ